MKEEKSSFFQAFYEFLFEFKQLDLINYDYKYLIYVASAALLGFIIIFIDYGVIRSGIKKESFFEIEYIPKKVILMIFVWTVSSGFIAWLGLMLGFLNDQVQSTAIAGFSWIYIFSNMIKKGSNSEDIQELIEEE